MAALCESFNSGSKPGSPEGRHQAGGCELVFTDVVSEANPEWSGLAEALSFLRMGDTLVLWKLDHLGRSLRHLMAVLKIKCGCIPNGSSVPLLLKGQHKQL
ncbi:MAG: recombinase family protein [Syntrophus sp. (in: bacteria)]